MFKLALGCRAVDCLGCDASEVSVVDGVVLG